MDMDVTLYIQHMYIKIKFIDMLKRRLTTLYSCRTYFPLTLIVMSSWVSFWLVKTDKGQEIPARTALGATCTLAVVTIGRT